MLSGALPHVEVLGGCQHFSGAHHHPGLGRAEVAEREQPMALPCDLWLRDVPVGREEPFRPAADETVCV